MYYMLEILFSISTFLIRGGSLGAGIRKIRTGGAEGAAPPPL